MQDIPPAAIMSSRPVVREGPTAIREEFHQEQYFEPQVGSARPAVIHQEEYIRRDIPGYPGEPAAQVLLCFGSSSCSLSPDHMPV